MGKSRPETEYGFTSQEGFERAVRAIAAEEAGKVLTSDFGLHATLWEQKKTVEQKEREKHKQLADCLNLYTNLPIGKTIHFDTGISEWFAGRVYKLLAREPGNDVWMDVTNEHT